MSVISQGTLAHENFSCIFLNENDTIPIDISLKYLPMSPIDNKPALVQIMDWRQFDYKQWCPGLQTFALLGSIDLNNAVFFADEILFE